ncbi:MULTISPECIES: hypothetical protein [unclassified Porphyromonas]|nr:MULTISPECIES: hypothetical protein [unclassified Porphyromonas]
MFRVKRARTSYLLISISSTSAEAHEAVFVSFVLCRYLEKVT